MTESVSFLAIMTLRARPCTATAQRSVFASRPLYGVLRSLARGRPSIISRTLRSHNPMGLLPYFYMGVLTRSCAIRWYGATQNKICPTYNGMSITAKRPARAGRPEKRIQPGAGQHPPSWSLKADPFFCAPFKPRISRRIRPLGSGFRCSLCNF